jgi:Flp pilus assembly protein TadB
MNPNSQMLSPTNLHVETTFLVGERKNSQKSNHSFHIISSLSINKTQLTQKINKHKLIKNNKNPKLRSPKLHLLTHKLPNQAGEKKNLFQPQINKTSQNPQLTKTTK